MHTDARAFRTLAKQKKNDLWGVRGSLQLSAEEKHDAKVWGCTDRWILSEACPRT